LKFANLLSFQLTVTQIIASVRNIRRRRQNEAVAHLIGLENYPYYATKPKRLGETTQ